MPKNKIEDLRDHLFETIEMLKEGDMKIDTAMAIKKVAETIVESAKTEVEFMKVIGADGSNNQFFSKLNETPALPQGE